MRVDPSFVGQTPAHSTDVRHYERDDAKRMSELMTRRNYGRSFSPSSQRHADKSRRETQRN